jgi:translation initiation factor 2 alpha subunit (eIF-2alpha)
MKNWALLVLLLLVSSVGSAQKRPLDLELDSSSFYKEAPKDSSWMQDENYKSSENQLSSDCQEMMEQIKALKGKPQRKFALQQRYDVECLK